MDGSLNANKQIISSKIKILVYTLFPNNHFKCPLNNNQRTYLSFHDFFGLTKKTKKIVMKTIYLILLIGVFVACNKSNDNLTQAQPPTSLTRIVKQTSGADISTFSYDASGKALKKENSNGSRKEYEYAGGKVMRKYYNTSGVYQYTITEELNAEGFSIHNTRSDQPWENVYEYNTDKTMAKQISKSSSTIVNDYFWSNGNLDSVRSSSQNGVWQYTTIFTYYTDKPNLLSDDIYGEQYWGKNSKNLLKTEVNMFPNGSFSNMWTYTYEFDNQGRIIKQTTSGSNGNVEVTLNTYNQ